jgi:hypothetical protein
MGQAENMAGNKPPEAKGQDQAHGQAKQQMPDEVQAEVGRNRHQVVPDQKQKDPEGNQ